MGLLDKPFNLANYTKLDLKSKGAISVRLFVLFYILLLVSALFFFNDGHARQADVSKAPLAAMQHLEPLQGKWELIVRSSFDNGTTWQKGETQIVELLPRHKGMILAELPEDLAVPGFHMESYLSFDQYRQVYRKAAIDDVWGIMDIYEGKLEGDHLVMDNLRSGTHFPISDGVWRAFRLDIELTQPNRKIVIDKSDDGGKTWQPAFVAEYKKV